MDKIIGRNREKLELQRIYNSGEAEFVVVYGRRRVGKTYLVREFFKDEFAFYHTGLSPIEYEGDDLNKFQLLSFYQSLLRYGATLDKVPENWFEAFNALIAMLETKKENGKRLVVFIDEMPWLDVPRKGFITAFESFWNGWGAGQHELMLVACGSATTWITDKLINNHGGLYGRVTREVKLLPFNLGECEEYFKHNGISMGYYDQVQSYMIFGGIPFYLSHFSPHNTIAQNVDKLLFSKSGILRGEFDRLFSSVFHLPENHKKVVRFLSTKREGFTRKEIAENLNISFGGGLSEILKALEASDFVTSYLNYKGSKRQVKYKLIDFFVLFYMRFVDGDKAQNESYWQENQFSAAVNSWRGFSFEQVCNQHLWQIKNALGFNGINCVAAPWKSQTSEKGAQIDLVIERADRVVNLCEMKFLNKPWRMTEADEMSIRTKVSDFIEETKWRHAVIPIIISSYGVEHNAHSAVFAYSITIEKLFVQNR